MTCAAFDIWAPLFLVVCVKLCKLVLAADVVGPVGNAQRWSVFGKIRTMWVRRLISSFSRSSMFVDFMCLWCWRGSR
jgi:hypothetical protein